LELTPILEEFSQLQLSPDRPRNPVQRQSPDFARPEQDSTLNRDNSEKAGGPPPPATPARTVVMGREGVRQVIQDWRRRVFGELGGVGERVSRRGPSGRRQAYSVSLLAGVCQERPLAL